MPPAKRTTPEPLRLEAALSGILALMVADRQAQTANNSDAIKTEVLLANAGLTADEISPLIGKSTAAVAKSIQRARKS